MKHLIIATALLTTAAHANLHLAPPDFDGANGRSIFVDFKTADYSITYDTVRETTLVKSRIVFEAKKSGKPLFDLIPNPDSLKIDGKKVDQSEISFPGGVSNLRQLSTSVNPGLHTLEVENEIHTNVNFHSDFGSVSSAFWIRDLKDRMFLEQYFPSNFEFDQYQMTFNVHLEGVEQAEQDIYTNGNLTKTSPVSWKIEFPEYFTVSCPYFHMTPKGWMKRLDFDYASVSGKTIPVTVYSPWKSRTKRFKPEAIRVLNELEADYGPWGHSSLVAYGTMKGTGGMEHSGATATSFGALDHEMLHSYFAKGVMPANGNSGWIDEAIASWRDKGYQRNPSTGFGGSDLGAHSVYKRNTDDRAYALGAAFMAYLDYRLQDRGGLKAFLRGYFQTYKHQVITTEHFKNNLEFFSGLNLSQDFGTYIWGKNSPDVGHLESEKNPHHLPLSKSQLHSLL
jgi:hypothetical protein